MFYNMYFLFELYFHNHSRLQEAIIQVHFNFFFLIYFYILISQKPQYKSSHKLLNLNEFYLLEHNSMFIISSLDVIKFHNTH